MNKKKYQEPTMELVVLQHSMQHLLAGSNYDILIGGDSVVGGVSSGDGIGLGDGDYDGVIR